MNTPSSPRTHLTRTATTAALAALLMLLTISCDNGTMNPTGPTPSGPSLGRLWIYGVPPEGIGVGTTVKLEAATIAADGTTTPQPNAAWSSSNPSIAEVNQNGELTGRAPGTATISAQVNELTASRVTGVHGSGLDDTFWRQFAFNEYDCATNDRCRPFEERTLSRLPVTSPNIMLVQDTLPPGVETRIQEAVPQAATQLTGARYNGKIEIGTSGSRDNWIIVEGVPQNGRGEICKISIEQYSGVAYVGSMPGCIVLNTSRNVTRRTIIHELGHAFGFHHVRDSQSIMNPGWTSDQYPNFATIEQEHAQFAYTQPRGATYAEISLAKSGMRFLHRPSTRRWSERPIIVRD